ncbi:MAG: hypothetical protein P4L11_15475 [Geothrix sp.]|nr:hypothetical protein [Geothrix sp.]
MNFLRALPYLALGVAMSAQIIDLKPDGGGDLTIGGVAYRFELTGLMSAPPRDGLPGAIRLEGDLVPRKGGRPFHMVLTVLKNGSLYLMHMERGAPHAYPDNWAATPKTRTRALKLEDRPGGRIELRCEGPVTGIIAKRPQDATWSGTLWATFPGG